MSRITKPFLVAAICLLGWWPGGGGAAAQVPAAVTPSEARIDPRAEAALKRASEHYRGLAQVRARVQVVMAMTRGDRDVAVESSYEFAFQRPNLLAMVGKTGMTGCNLFSDGRTLCVHMPVTNAYVQQPAPETALGLVERAQPALAGSPSGGIETMLLMALLSDNPYRDLTQGPGRVEHVGTETGDDRRPREHLRFVETEGRLDLWLEAGSAPWLARLEPSIDDPAMPIRVSIVFTDWSGQPLPRATFSFEPPAGARRVSSLEEIFGLPEEPEPGPDASP